MPQQESLWSTLAPVAKKPVPPPVTPAPATSEVEAFLFILADEYWAATTKYINSVCSGSFVNGQRQPATTVEAKFANRYLKNQLQAAQDRAAEKYSLTPGTVQAAIRKYQTEGRVKQ